MTAVLRILGAGPGVTLQDGGRQGYLRFGVTPAGPMDRLAFDTANRALGLNPGATAIEVGLGGLDFTAEGAVLAIAIAGGDFAVTLDGAKIPTPVLLRLEPGAKCRIAAGRAGSWCYVAIGGRIDLPPMLGSTATHTRSGFGGIEGRGLKAGDVLAIAEPHLPTAFGLLAAPWLDRPAETIRVVLGPQEDYFAADQVAAFLTGPWTVSARGDRMAYFLEGPKLTHEHGFNIVSDGIAMGAIQVPGEGQPIVLMADRQPTGGYPKIATVIGADLGRLAQARPGQKLRFEAVSAEEAVMARRAEVEVLKGTIAVSPLVRTEFSTAFLLGTDLTDQPAIQTADAHGQGKLTPRERLEVLFDDAAFAQTESGGLLRAEGLVAGRAVNIVSDAALLRVFSGDTAAPKLALVFGSCTGVDALSALTADVVILARDAGSIAAGGSDLVQRVTNEALSSQEIGGPAVLAAAGAFLDVQPHDLAVLMQARRMLDALPDGGERAEGSAAPQPVLDRLVPRGETEIYDMRDLLRVVLDGGALLDIAADESAIITGFARIGGLAVGVLASQPLMLAGVLDAASLTKAASFVACCGRLELPLLSVLDCPGLLPGPVQERAGLMVQAAALNRALMGLKTPRVNLITRHARGMVPALFALSPDSVLRWPCATPGDGTEIAPQETRGKILAAFGERR